MIRFCFFTLFLSIISLSYGQWIDGRNFFLLGISNSSISTNDFESRDRIGWNSGFGARIETFDFCDFEMYISFGTMGATLTCRESDGIRLKPEPVESRFFFNRIGMNFRASYVLIDPTLRLSAGFCYGTKFFTFKRIEEGRFYVSKTDSLSDAIDVAEMFSELPLEVGLIAGISVGTEDYEIELSYTRFITNICKPVDYNNVGYKAYNSLLELKFRYFIEILG
ncbi:MAG: hypothetical protein AB7V36_02470 [Bacteroidales bacterium]